MRCYPFSTWLTAGRVYRAGPKLPRPGRWLLTLVILAALCVTALGPSVPANAYDPPGPAARLQVIIKSIQVKNDRDGFWTGDGDLQFSATFWRCSGNHPPCEESLQKPAQLMAQWKSNFDLGSGKTRNLDHVLPLAADVKDGLNVSEEQGLLVDAGRDYVFQVFVFEKDVAGGDYMGGVQRIVNSTNGWAIGTYDSEPAGYQADGSIRAVDFVCAGCGEIIVGDYSVSYEIRRTPLADLHAKSLRLVDPEPAPGSTDPNVCLTVENIGVVDAGPFKTGVAINQTLVPGAVATLPGLAVGATQESCIHTTFADTGAQQLDLIADLDLAVPESDEANNVVGQAIARALPVASPAPAAPGAAQSAGPANSGIVGPKSGAPGSDASPSPVQADLTVGAIKVNGQVPDGKNDCKDGKNTISVVVKNSGAGKAQSFGVRLHVDDADADEQSVNGLEAGKEREIKFEDVRLKKGDHKLTATVDAGSSISESNEDNNQQKISARCSDVA